ncbi:MAG TPA: prolyl oligopeptidase family serine peptidase, partial [Telluria sp.]|nr:prolyl oligopeptidase family serine peptidase [Telluria sp.]
SGARRLRQADPQGVADLGSVVLDPASQLPLFAAFRLPQVHYAGLTGAARRAAADIAARFPHSNIAIAPAAGRWLLTETAATLGQPRYWLYEPARHSFAAVLEGERAQDKPLGEAQLAAKYPVAYPASDGRTIRGYLTLPPGRDAAKAPLITVVHGGPWSHFESGYEWFVQWMATRGYAVFQPNFRASTGYGDKFMLAPGTDFGNGRVQRDIIDGVRWLTANGIGDRERMAITGGSFGGYSTLLALTWNPELFRFGLAMVPPPEFARTLADAAAAHLPGEETVPFAVRFDMMGLRFRDEAAMETIRASAPAAHPDRIGRPLVIMAGGKDDKVRLETVTAYVARLQALGKPVSLLVDPDEGHNARNPLVRDAYAYLMASLLHRYLDGPAPAAPAPELKAYLERTMKADGALAP